jgi:hypothetical protein
VRLYGIFNPNGPRLKDLSQILDESINDNKYISIIATCFCAHILASKIGEGDRVLLGLHLNRLINNVLLLKSILYRHLRQSILNLIAWEVFMKSIIDYSCAQISTNVSAHLKSEYHNGKIYYEMNSRKICLPDNPLNKPSQENLEYHQNEIFLR